MRRLALIALAAVVCGGIGTAFAVAFPGRQATKTVAAEPSSLIDTVTAEPTPTPTASPTPSPSPAPVFHTTPRRLPAPTVKPTRRPLPTFAPATPCNEDESDDCPTERPTRTRRPRDTPEPTGGLGP